MRVEARKETCQQNIENEDQMTEYAEICSACFGNEAQGKALKLPEVIG